MAVQSLHLHQESPFSHAKDAELINVFVRFVDGKTQTLLVNPFLDDIHSIKKRVASRSCSSRDLFVISNGKPLGDDCVLADYFLKEGATLFISHRKRGGCFMISISILMIILMSLVGSTCTCGLSLVVIPFLMPFLFVLPLFCL